MTPLDWYDPREHGALCDRCPLAREGSGPVPPERHPRSLLWTVAEAPGKQEVELKRPLVGPSGAEHGRAMAESGVRRDQSSYTNVLLCRPPKGQNLVGYLAEIRRRNKRLVKMDKEPYLLPTRACLPRLLRELSDAKALLLMGAFARSALAADQEGKGEEGLMKARGFPAQARIGDRLVPALATVHPAFVLRRRRWTTIYRSDVAKAFRMARGELRWQEPEMHFFPTNAELRSLLERFDASGRPVSYDVETYHAPDMPFDSRTDKLRCIGIGTDEVVTCVPYQSVEGRRRHTSAEERERDAIVLAWFAKRGYRICAHNELYDRQVMESNLPGFEMGRKVFDTIIAHHVVWSELPHDLGFCAAQYTDAPQHKDVDHDAWESDYELHKYCMLDVAHTSYLAEQLARDQRLREQRKAFVCDLGLSTVCRKMHEIGHSVDLTEAAYQYKVQTEIMERKQHEARRLATRSLELLEGATPGARKLARSLNPNSPPQLRAFLFDSCGIAPVDAREGGYTDSGEPSTSKDILFALIDKGLPDVIEECILAVIDYKEASKLRGTYCQPKPARDTGRMHPTWSPHVVLSGRFSCSGPNLMNVPFSMKGIHCAGPGHLLVSCDKAQLEARLAAWFSGMKWQIAAFLAGADMHTLTTAAILDKAPEDVTKKERKFGKTTTFAAQYLAGVKKVRQMVRNFRDNDGTRPFRQFTHAQAEQVFKRFWDQRKKLLEWHAANRESYQKLGYIAEPLHGRRRYFLDGGQDDDVKEEKANFIPQSAAAADVNDATFRLIDEFPWGFDGPFTGLNLQCHDELQVECRKENAERVAIRMQEILYSEVGDMPLPVDINVGYSRGTFVEYKRDGNKLIQA